MARWDESRRVWRITATASRPGQPRRRVVQSVEAPRGRAGRRVAEAAEAKLRAETYETQELDLPGGAVADSFARAAEAWVESNPRWSPKTAKEVRYALRRYILPTIGATPLPKVTAVQIEAMYADWVRAGYADSTMRRWHGIVRAIFTDAERLGLLRQSPMNRVRPAGGSAPERMHIPEPHDVRRAIDAAASPMAALFFELAVGTGARRGSLTALRWRDIDLTRGTVTFRHAIAVGKDGPVIKGTKANRPYAVHLPARTVTVLRAAHARAVESALPQGLAGRLDGLFLFSADGGPTHWSVDYPSRAWRLACARAGVTGCRLHDLRHFAASRMLAEGIPYRVVAERLGCTEANVMRTYSHWVPTAEDARAAEVLGRVLG